MNDVTVAQAQADMRRGYLFGAPGVLVSGLVWLVAGGVAVFVADRAAVLSLLVGGALIHPLGVLVEKALGRPGTHTAGNPLARLAGETTVSLLVGLVIAFAVSTVRLEWFFPAVLLVIGGRYLAFQTLYGVRTYWVCGGVLCVAGLGLGLLAAPVAVGAFTGGAVEVVTAAVLFVQARREGTSHTVPSA